MSNLTIRQLRYFEALSRHRHFGRAAEACAISQPALSIQMKELEAMLGAPLIERGARQLRLSELGEALAVRARDILRAVSVHHSGLSHKVRRMLGLKTVKIKWR